MNQITFENMINNAPKELVLNVIVNELKMNKSKTPLLSGFRNNKLDNAPENILKNLLIERIRNFNLHEYDIEDGPETLDDYEKVYNEKKYKCFTQIIINTAAQKNIDITIAAYKKFFAPKSINDANEGANEANNQITVDISSIQQSVAEMSKKLSDANEKYKKDLAKQNEKYQKDLAKKNESIENLKKAKKDKEREVDELKEKVDVLKEDYAILENENNNLKNNIEVKENEIDILNREMEKLRAELKEAIDKLEQDKPHIVIYGYPKDFYGCDVREDVLQPDTFQNLLDIGKKYKVAELYYRPLSISRMSSVVLSKTYPGIVIAAKDLLELESMGYLNRNIKGDN